MLVYPLSSISNLLPKGVVICEAASVKSQQISVNGKHAENMAHTTNILYICIYQLPINKINNN